MASLKQLTMEHPTSTLGPQHLATLFKNLNVMEELRIILGLQGLKDTEVLLPSETLRQNHNLKSLEIAADRNQSTVFLPEEFLIENMRVKEARIGRSTGYSGRFRVPETTFSHLKAVGIPGCSAGPGSR